MGKASTHLPRTPFQRAKDPPAALEVVARARRTPLLGLGTGLDRRGQHALRIICELFGVPDELVDDTARLVSAIMDTSDPSPEHAAFVQQQIGTMLPTLIADRSEHPGEELAALPLRFAVSDLQVGDVTVPAGDAIITAYAAAGLDPARPGGGADGARRALRPLPRSAAGRRGAGVAAGARLTTRTGARPVPRSGRAPAAS